MKMKWTIVAISLLLTASYAVAQEFKDITADELKKMIDRKEKVVLVDSRGKNEYSEGHIPTAINILPEKFPVIHEFLPEDKKAFIIFYCRGGTG